ncbi:MAG: hypothetical protein ABI273_00760 [Lacunisphaera sp.]
MNTKNKSTSARLIPVALLAASLSALAFTGCSKHDQDKATDKMKDAYQDTKDAVSNGWDNVKSYTFDKRNDFAANAKAMSSKLESQIAEVRANYSEATASASRKAAMEELKNSEADYKEKLSALGNATADTWDSAKQNVIASWDKMKASYDKARAN